MNAGSVPSGVLALAGEPVRRQREAENRCLDLLAREGFQQVVLPILEVAEEAGAAGYRFVDGAGRVLALRTDFTPLAARILARSISPERLPLKVCYAGEVVRPQPTQLRQLPELYQLGFESYGPNGGAVQAMEITLRLARAAGVNVASCHLSVGVAGLAERILAGLLGRPAGGDLVELARVHDVDALIEATGARGARAEALAAALLGEPVGAWADALGVAREAEAVVPLLEIAGRAGVPATVEVAPRLAAAYYRGAVFSLWGRRTRTVVAAGGEYEVEAAAGLIPAVGACLALGIALEEADEEAGVSESRPEPAGEGRC